ncbi:hypothetical protein L0F63_006702 [Massospora cicadina]|nr:hypothetical protein L0F63_006702 [Massospora cicadina]
MFNSLKDRLNSAVNAGIVPKLEDARKRLSSEEVEAATKVGPSALSPSRTELNSELDGPGEEAKATVPNKGGPLVPAETELAADHRSSVDSSREVAAEEGCGTELPEEIQRRLEKLKRYEVKYPELANAYKSQMAKLKRLDQVLQALTPVQTYSDHDGLEEYLKNLVSQTEMTTSEFKTISKLKNQLEIRIGELQSDLTSATARIDELQAEKDALQKPQEFSLPELLQRLQEKIQSTELTSQDDATRHGLSELATQVTQGLGHNEMEERARDAAQALKEARDQLDSLSQEHQATLAEVDTLRQKAVKADLSMEHHSLLQSKYDDLCQLCPNSDDPVSSLGTHLQTLTDGRCELEKKIAIQNGIVTSLKQDLDAKAAQVAALTKEVETLKAAAPQAAPPGALQANGAVKPSTGKKKKRKGASAQNQPPSANFIPQTEPQAEVDLAAYHNMLTLVEEKKGELEAASKELTSTTCELEGAKSQLTTVQAKLDAQALELEHTLAKLSDLNSRHEALELSHSEVQSELESHKAKRAELLKQLKASECRVENLSKQLEAATQLETQLSDLKRQLKGSQSDVKQQQATVEHLSKKVAKLETELATKDAALSDSKRQCALIEKEKKALVAEHSTLQSQMESTVVLSKKKDEEMATRQAEIKALKDECELHKAKLAEAGSKSSNLLAQVEALRNTLEAEKASTHALAEENVRLKELAELSVKGKEETQQNLDDHIQSLTELRQELDDLKKRGEVLDQELVTSRQLFKDKAARLDALHLQHVRLQESATEEAAKLSCELQAYKDKHQQAQKELEAYRASTGDEIQLLRGQLAETQLKLDESAATIQELSLYKHSSSKELAELKSSLESLTATHQSYESELGQARERIKRLNQVEEEIKRISLEKDDLLEQSKLRESHLRNLNRDLKEEVKRLQRPGSSTMSSPPVSPTDPPEHGEHRSFNLEYLRNIIFKFLADKDHRPQLVTVLSHLLKFSPTETRKLMETLRT